MNKQTKILYLFDQSDWKSRMPLAIEAQDEGYEVIIALIGNQKDSNKILKRFKTTYITTPEGRFRGLSLLKMTRQIHALITAEKPDLIHAVTLKYAFISGLAALPFKALHKIYTLAGLGYLFRSDDKKAALIRTLLSPLLKTTLKAANTHLIFQNPDDLELMIDMKYATLDHATLIRGSGVDLDEFVPTPESESDAPIVLMPTRLVHEKGVRIFVEAAHILKNNGIHAHFQIAGGETLHNPKAITRNEMLEMTKDGATQWLGHVENMPELLASAALIVYPSYYGEGIPRVLLESCAMGKPIVTTDHPGCREAVDHKTNGLLVPIKDAPATAKAIKLLLEGQEMRHAMGVQSRKKAELEFDIHIIVHKTLSVYNAVLKR